MIIRIILDFAVASPWRIEQPSLSFLLTNGKKRNKKIRTSDVLIFIGIITRVHFNNKATNF